MPHAYAVLVWDRVFYLDTWDPAAALQFYNTEDERLDKDGVLIQPPEDLYQCNAALHSASPAASGSAAPSGGSSAAPAAGSPAPSASSEPSPAPS
jgi:hypothetical protein